MKAYQSADIRNFAVVGHGSSGKTMLCEAMLANGGVINRLGSITNGSTVSDYHEDEKKRQISIHASFLHTEWMGKKFNIIDTPGYLDFISDSLGAFKEAFKSAKPYLLEPIYKVEIKVPDECLGDVMGDISGRRGRIQGMEAKGNSQIIIAQVPQMELYRYSTTLRSITGGRGIHSEEFSHYEEMQRDLEQKVIAASKQPQED